MNNVSQFGSLLEFLGGAGLAFYIMFLWLKHVKKESEDKSERIAIQDSQIADLQEARLNDTKEVIPLLAEASSVLQSAITKIEQKETSAMDELKRYIDEKFT